MRKLCLLLTAVVSASAAVDFNRDIRPILSDKCFACHGPDDKNRRAKLRLDTEAGAKADLGGRAAVVPGDAARSMLYQRIIHKSAGLRMPPLSTGHTLSDREISLLREWIEGGAAWQGHWSFLKPVRPPLPEVSNKAWPKNAVDRFLLARLEREGLQPSPEADRRTLIRRLSFDLTGIPPTPAEVAAFVNDPSPDAYEKVVDRLLQSQRYGERMAVRWLDAARYADTNGYQTDAERSMWRWRDWVIDAFNRNMPFDRFTVEQLAGDLLPNATRDQIIATAFNRNHRGNGEGGSIPEEFLVEYAVDRLDTTSTVWMGVTLACARCHDHKYDPFSQKEFYRFYGFFNNIPEKGKVFKYGNSPPLIPAPTPPQEEELKAIEDELAKADNQFERSYRERKAAQAKWEASLDRTQRLDWAPGPTTYSSGKLDGNGVFDGKRFVDAGDVGEYGMITKFSLSVWVKPEKADGAIVSRAKDVEEEGGYGLYLRGGKVQVNMVARWLDDCLRVETVDAIPLNKWTHLAMSYDASRTADGIRLYVNGEQARLKYIVDDLNQEFRTKEPLRIGAGNGMRFHGAIDDVRIYDRTISGGEAAVLATATPVNELVGIDPANRTRAQADKVEWCFLDQFAPQPIRANWHEVRRLRLKRERHLDSLPTVMVMQERPQIRDTFVLNRGQYDQPREKVTRGVPAALPPLPPDASLDRLGLARWLVSPDHPLTARVTVNRMWQTIFGVGIVKTVEDFGSQGEWPVHPELLDWLAVEFVESGWNLKALIRTMVTSAAYRQSSKATPEALQRDPENRLLARGVRNRLSPEMVRDQALAVSDLLVEKLGGPSVKPYQPAGLWKELSGGTDYQRDTGENLYRRSMYTYWKRASPPPGLMTFDSSGRETCTVRESRTNTPLQALTLMNDETYLEAARKVAERMMREGGGAPADRIGYAFELVLSRRPKTQEARILEASFTRNLERFRADAAAAKGLLTQGESKADPSLDAPELAAYATVASLILNLDEAITKE